MKLKRIVWYCKCIGLYGNYLSRCLSDIPSIPQYEGERKRTKPSQPNYKREQVRTV